MLIERDQCWSSYEVREKEEREDKEDWLSHYSVVSARCRGEHWQWKQYYKLRIICRTQDVREEGKHG